MPGRAHARGGGTIPIADLISRLRGKPPRGKLFEVAPADRFLVLAPHADDETLGAGGLMATAIAAGAAVSVAVLTDGTGLGRGPGDRAALMAWRQAQCRAALAELSVADVAFLDAPDRRLDASAGRVAADLAPLVDAFRPTHILLPHPNDRHRDHRACLQLVRRTLRRVRTRPDMLLGYEIWAPCLPTDCVDITAVVETKRRALACYRETFGADLGEMILGLNRYRAASEMIGDGWCEAYRRLR